jgi:hypothetical protein
MQVGERPLSRRAIETQIDREVEMHQIPRPVLRVPGLQEVVQLQPDGVLVVDFVHIALVAEVERLEVGRERATVNLRQVDSAS